MTHEGPYTPLLLIRHAQSEWNAAGRWQGHADPPLSAAGRAQARALVEALACESERPTRIASSDLQRAREMAELLGLRLGLPVSVDRRYRELDVGEWSGLRRTDIERRDGVLLARFDREDATV